MVGGAVPRQFIPSVEKGVRAQMERGLVAGYPAVDLKVTLTDGKAHSVDSSDMAFQTAGALALREAAAAARTSLLEPVDEIAVLVPDDLVGTVMSDLSGRRGRVLGSEPVGDDRTLVRAEVPQIEITRYAIDLRAFSHGCRVVQPEVRPLRADAGQPGGQVQGVIVTGSAGCSASCDREARCASQCSTSASYPCWPIISTSSRALET